MPHDTDAEQSLLGAAFLSTSVLDLVQTRAVELYDPRHRVVWAAMRRLHELGKPLDDVTVGAELDEEGKLAAVGSHAYLAELMFRTPTADNAEHYAAIIHEHYVRRHLMLEAGAIVEAARRGDADAGDLQGEAIERLRKIDTARDQRGSTMGDLMVSRLGAATELSERRAQGDVVAPGLPTGIPALDDALGCGLRRGIPTVLCGRPGHGKSAMAQTIILANVSAGVGVIEFRVEDTDEASADRMLSRISNVPAEDLAAGKLSRMDLAALTQGVERWHKRCRTFWHLDGRGDVSADDIVRDVRRRRSEIPNLQLVVVDLLNELRWPRGADSMKDAMSRGIRTLGRLARDDNLVVLVLCQLNRKLEERKDKRPRLIDLKETGALEERAKCVLSVYRGIEYGDPTDGVDYLAGESRPPASEWQERIEIGVIKNSQGKNNRAVRAKWHGPTVRVYA